MTDSFWLGEAMRGEDQQSESFFSYVRLEARIPADHPLRAIRELVDAALRELSRSFDRLYAREGRPSIPPERLLRALLLQAFYTVRSEPFDSSLPRLSRDPLSSLDMDGMKGLASPLDIKADCVHRAVGISKRIGN